MRFFISIIALLGLYNFSLLSQNVYQGRVLDKATGEVLVGVSVYNETTQSGTTTDQSGRFQFKFSGNDEHLTFSYLGYQKLIISVYDLTTMKIILMESSPISLETVVVTSNKEMQSRMDAPIAISSLTKSMLNETKPKLLYEAVNKIAGVHMVNLGNEEHSMSIRQPFTTRAVFLYMEDGIPLRPTGLYNHNALIEVNMDGISRMEIIKGPVSSLYGGNAIGGAINVITQTPSFYPVAEVGLQQDNFGYKRLDLTTGTTMGELGIFVGGYLARQRDGWRDHSDFDKNSLTIRSDYFISNNLKLTGTFSSNYLKSDMTGALDSASFYGKNYSSLQTFTYRDVNSQRGKLSLSYHWNQEQNSVLTVFARNNSIGQIPGYRMQDDKKNKAKAKTEMNEQSFTSTGFLAQHIVRFSWLDSKLISGLYLDRSPSTYYAKFVPVTRDINSGRYVDFMITDSLLAQFDADVINSAAYLQYEWLPTNNLRLVSGLRYDRLDYDYKNYLSVTAASGSPSERNHFDGLSPKLGFTYQVNQSNGFYGNYSYGFLPPEISELYRNVKVPYLKPSYFNNYEVGGWAAIFSQKLFVDVSLYLLGGKNEIIAVLQDDGSTINENSGATEHKGIELTLNYNPLSDVMIRVGGSYAKHIFIFHQSVETINGQKVNVSYDGKVMPSAPRWITNSEITYKPTQLTDFRISLEMQTVGEYYLDLQNSKKYEGYTIFNFRSGYKLLGITMWGNIQNLTNKLYAHNATFGNGRYQYTPGAARTFTFGISYGL